MKTESSSSEPPPTKPQPIAQLGDLRLGPKLGSGSMGKVYRARHVTWNRDVAVKVLLRRLTRCNLFVRRFQREAKMMAKLDHPAIVKFHMAGKDHGRYYFAMELVEGYSLREWLTKIGRMKVADALSILRVCTEALRYAHGQGLIHRDIKPENILLTREGQCKITDFGLAKGYVEHDLTLTQSGRGAGTPVYVAPEQARNARDADPRSDIYALGCTFYHLITGELPFKGVNSLEVVLNKLDGKYRPAGEVCPDLPKEIDELILDMLAPHPDDRFQSCQELLEAIERLGLAAARLSFLDEVEPAELEALCTAKNGVESSSSVQIESPSSPWYVRHRSPNQSWVSERMTTSQLQWALRNDQFRQTVQVGTTPEERRSLHSFPELSGLVTDRRADEERAAHSVLVHFKALRDAELRLSWNRRAWDLVSTPRGWAILVLAGTSLFGIISALSLLSRLF